MHEEQIFQKALSRYRQSGYALFFCTLGFAIFGTILWRWYAIPIAILSGFTIGQVLANRFYNDLSKHTGQDKTTLRIKMPEANEKLRFRKYKSFKHIQTQKKRPLGVIIISASLITYGVLDIIQLFMPTRTETTIEYSFPILGILFIINGIGIFALIEWARKGMIIACSLAIIMSVPTFIQPFPLNVVSSLSIIIFGLIIFYLMRKTIKNSFMDKDSNLNPFSILGDLTGIENKVRWSQSKKIEIIGPDFLGHHFIYVDPNFNVALFLPKADRTLHIFIGDILRAHRWIKCDQGGRKIIDETPPEEAFQWKINPKNIWYRGTGFPSDKPGHRGEVISSEHFYDEINEEWINNRIKEYIHVMSA
jgi:hypothetical protein